MVVFDASKRSDGSGGEERTVFLTPSLGLYQTARVQYSTFCQPLLCSHQLLEEPVGGSKVGRDGRLLRAQEIEEYQMLNCVDLSQRSLRRGEYAARCQETLLWCEERLRPI